MTPPNSNYTFYFKLAYTEHSCYYSFNPDTTIKQLIYWANDFANIYFNLYTEETIEFTVEVIEAGHPNNVLGPDAEMAPKLNYPDTATLREIYENNWKTTAFYLRGPIH